MNADALPSHDPSAEAAIHGCILLDPKTLPAVREALRSLDAFYVLSNREIYTGLLSLDAAGKAIDTITLAAQLRASGKLEHVGGLGYLSGLTDNTPCAANLPHYLRIVRDHFLTRRETQIEADAKADLEANPELAATIRKVKLAALSELYADATREPGKDLPTILATRRFNFAVIPPPVTPRYSSGVTPISTPGNITAISGGPKTAKSSVMSAMIAASMTPDNSGADCLGVRSSNPDGKAVIHLDTEQSIEDHDAMLRRAIKRARIDTPPAWFQSFCVTGLAVNDLRLALRILLESAVKEFGGIHSVFLDGVADFVCDVNDPAECNAFVAELHATAIRYATSIVGVIHVNPGSEKTRDHLGSQLERKAETNLRLERDGEAIVCWSDKNRRAPIPKERGPRFVWSDELGMHVSTECAGVAKDEAKRSDLLLEADAVFSEARKTQLSWRDFHVLLEQNARLKPGTARKHFAEMLRTSVLAKNIVGNYQLTQ